MVVVVNDYSGEILKEFDDNQKAFEYVVSMADVFYNQDGKPIRIYRVLDYGNYKVYDVGQSTLYRIQEIADNS